MININEIGKQFQQYMTERGYNSISSDSLVNETFPTCFTVSGGPNFVGKSNGPYVVIQPCHRYWDIEKVGDKTHLSFFEMAVTFSDNPLDRERILQDQLSFLRSIKLDNFTAHYFDGGTINNVKVNPDEVKPIWESLGIEKFVPHTDMESYVANQVEPYGGPRTELFFPSNIGELELFTSVLYDQRVEKGEIVSEYNPPTIAAGFGLERVVQAINGLESISTIFKKIDNNPIVADHIRGLAFLAKDGAFELSGDTNSSRKTILNRYLRNFFKAFGDLDYERLKGLIGKTIEFYQSRYPNLIGKEDEFYTKIAQRAERLDIK
ncbi:MAG: alanine--tRNA ligase-related protein [Candidatus Zapsychrus exili]|nr:alanine--tRNA ligase-related protein [Candidatus Zapsychrus exili]